MHVAWTSMIYMATYIPLMFVATWMLDNWGLKKILVFGGCLNAAGALIKLASLSKDRFWVSFLGSSIFISKLFMANAFTFIFLSDSFLKLLMI